MKKLDYVDALRGLAILAVIMIHTTQSGSFHVPGFVGKITGQGPRGVQLFYLASAFTLFLSFKNRFAKETFPIRNFFLRRFFRIAPMYYLGICYYLIQEGLGPRYALGDETHITVLNILSNFTFLHAFNPYWINSVVPGGWSIGVEMIFYAVLPFLFSKIKNITQAFNFFLVSLILKLVLHAIFKRFHLIGDERLWNDFLFFYFPSQLPVFILGVLMYFIVIEGESLTKISRGSLFVFIGLVIARFATGIPALFPSHILFGIGFLILGVFLSVNRFKLIVNPLINYIGKISFSMYLVHFEILHWLVFFNFIDYFENGVLNYVTRFLIVSTLTILVSTISYNLIEIPFQNLGKAIIERRERKSILRKGVLQNAS